MPWRACFDYLNRKDIQNNERSDVLFRGPAGACVFAAQIRQRREVVHPFHPLGEMSQRSETKGDKKRGTPLLQQVPLLCVLKPKPIT